jgi:hypothetical protein
MAIANVRVVGSNYSTFQWNGVSIAYLERVVDQGVVTYGPVEAIHPLGEKHVTEFAVPRILRFGTMTLTIRELWEKPVWQHLAGLAGANDLLDVWAVLASDPSPVTCVTAIKPPQGNIIRTKTYHNVVIQDIDDSETIDIGSMSVARSLTCVYTHSTRAVLTAS